MFSRKILKYVFHRKGMKRRQSYSVTIKIENFKNFQACMSKWTSESERSTDYKKKFSFYPAHSTYGTGPYALSILSSRPELSTHGRSELWTNLILFFDRDFHN